MKSTPILDLLCSDDLYMEGVIASDVKSLWRQLSRSRIVRTVAANLSSDHERIRDVVSFVRELIEEEHDRAFRHPNDIAICAALVIIQDSPLSEVRSLFYSLRRNDLPSLVWIKRIASYCDDRFCKTAVSVSTIGPNIVLTPETIFVTCLPGNHEQSLEFSLDEYITANDYNWLSACPFPIKARRARMHS